MPSSSIELKLINRSNVNNAHYVIFQKNIAEHHDEFAIAWKVVNYLPIGGHHPFTYQLEIQVAASDSFGNFTPSLSAVDGQGFDMVRSLSGDTLQISKVAASSPTTVEVRNTLPIGAISAHIYRDGRLLASKTDVCPGQKAVFEFKPKLYIGAVSQIAEGDVIHSAILETINQELDLFGLQSADIVITGGGPNAPFEFTLQRVA